MQSASRRGNKERYRLTLGFVFIALLVIGLAVAAAHANPPDAMQPAETYTPPAVISSAVQQIPAAPPAAPQQISAPAPSPAQTPAVVPPAALAQIPAAAPSQVLAPTSTESTVSDDYGFALGSTLLGLDNAELTAELDTIASLGVGGIRIDFDWSTIQPRNSAHYYWGNYDRIVAAANARHIQILGLLGYAPMWAAISGCTSMRCPPAEDSQFAQFATAVVDHFAPQGLHTWEIWNEPNNAGFWEPAANAQAYTQLLKAAYPAIKNADPSAIVITGGLAPEATDGRNIAPIDFLGALYADGAGGNFDAVGFHPYSYPAMPGYPAQWNAWQQMAQTNPSLRSVMIANGDGNKQIWMTEYGAPTGGPGALESSTSDTFFMGSPDHVTEALQAQMIAAAITLAGGYAWAGPIFIYSYQDLGTSMSTNENFFGILRYDGSQKPAYQALMQAIASRSTLQ